MPVSRIASMLPGSGTSITSGARRGFAVETTGSPVRTAAASVCNRWRSTRRGTTPATKRTAKTAPAASKMRRRRCGSGAGMTAGSMALIRGAPAGPRSPPVWAKHAVDDGDEHERGEGGEHESPDDDAPEGSVLLASLAEPERHGEHAEDH